VAVLRRLFLAGTFPRFLLALNTSASLDAVQFRLARIDSGGRNVHVAIVEIGGNCRMERSFLYLHVALVPLELIGLPSE
jgi:hypothetical protein